MLNFERFDKAIQPTESELKEFANTELLGEIDSHLRDVYKVKPKYAYSSCAMDKNIWRGWNMKYQKSGKSLCTIYPQEGYFMALVPGKGFEVRDEKVLGEVKLAVEHRFDEISKKKT